MRKVLEVDPTLEGGSGCIAPHEEVSSPLQPGARRGTTSGMPPSANDDWIEDFHIRAARGLLRWDQPRLAEAIGKHATMVRRLETGRKVPSSLRGEVAAALRKAGVVFLPPTRIDGADTLGGVALSVVNAMDDRKRYKVGAGQEPTPDEASKKP